MKYRWVLLGFLVIAMVGGLLTEYAKRARAKLELSDAKNHQQSLAEELLQVQRERIDQDLFLVQRIHTRSGEAQPGLSPADMDIVVSALQFAATTKDSAALANHLDARARVKLTHAMTSCLLGNWGLGATSLRESKEDFTAEFSKSRDFETALEIAVAGNLETCLNIFTGNRSAAMRAVDQVEQWSEQALKLAKDQSDMQRCQWEKALASRSRAILLEASEKDGTADAEKSLEVALKLFDTMPDRGLYQWDLPHFLLDAWQLASFLHLRHDNQLAAQNIASRALEALPSLEAEVIRVGAQRGNGMRQAKLARARAFLTAASNDTLPQPSSAAHAFPTIDRRTTRTLHPDLLVSGRMPAEFERQQEICFAWTDEFWSRKVQAETICKVAAVMPVRIFVNDSESRQQATAALAAQGLKSGQVQFTTLPIDTIWLRDFGPKIMLDTAGLPFVLDFYSGPRGTDFRLNNENAPGRYASEMTWPLAVARILLEGGEMLSNGEGIVLVSSPMLDANRASGIEVDQAMSVLHRITGAKTIIPIMPLFGDPTAHIDSFATFTDVDSLVVSLHPDPSHPNAKLLDMLSESVAGIETSKGPLRVTRIPMPPEDEMRKGRNYTNVIYANGTLLMPSWNSVSPELEQKALDTYRQLLPDWKIETVRCDDLAARGGALHCISLNIPVTAESAH